MRDHGAPEAGGSRQVADARLTGWLSLAVLLSLTLAPSPFSFGQPLAAASGVDATQHQLQVASSKVGPHFALRDLEGLQHELREHAGRIVLVHFFATWCEPCREELSSLSSLAERLGSERASILAVNVAEVPTRVRRLLESVPVRFPVLLDADRAVTKAWDVSVLPTTFVLDRKLSARLLVEGDVDWSRPDVLAALERVGTIDLQ
jgi:thiol-disulfide isomerase/thioredoxin